MEIKYIKIEGKFQSINCGILKLNEININLKI